MKKKKNESKSERPEFKLLKKKKRVGSVESVATYSPVVAALPVPGCLLCKNSFCVSRSYRRPVFSAPPPFLLVDIVAAKKREKKKKKMCYLRPIGEECMYCAKKYFSFI
jgi:hypothetical protein